VVTSRLVWAVGIASYLVLAFAIELINRLLKPGYDSVAFRGLDYFQFGGNLDLVQVRSFCVLTMPDSQSTPSPINEYLAHRFGSGAEEMLSILPMAGI